MALRLRRRMKDNLHGGQINLRRTIRRSIGFGGEPIDLLRKTQRPKKTTAHRVARCERIDGQIQLFSFVVYLCASGKFQAAGSIYFQHFPDPDQ